jgi:tetratricopeptide (TPR) repeat protein
MRIRAFALSAALWLVPAANSQTNTEGSTLKGQIETSVGPGFTAQLFDAARHMMLFTSDVKPDGAFEFRGATAGSYLLIVADERGDPVYQTSVNLGGPFMTMQIHLPESQAARPISGTISARQLQHVPSRKAFEAMVQAQKFSEAGDFSKAAAWLEKAVALSPDCADAHTNLGAQYLRLGRYADSIAETKRALALDGATAPLLCNLAFAQLQMGQDAEAMESAGAALRANPSDAHSHYIMGLALFVSHGPMDQVTAHLELAGRTLAAANETLRKIRDGAK